MHVGRARRRTGAVRWSVYRDAERPERFIEMFIVPTWQEHVRQHERRTVTDAGPAGEPACLSCRGHRAAGGAFHHASSPLSSQRPLSIILNTLCPSGLKAW